MSRIESLENLCVSAKQSGFRVMFDANVLIALLDECHKYHEYAKKYVGDLYMSGSELFYVQPCYLEILDFWRRRSITKYLNLLFMDPNNSIPGRFSKAYKYHLSDLEKHSEGRSDKYFQDYVIKDLRDHLLRVGGKNHQETGRRLWVNLCKKALGERFQKVHQILNKLEIKYAKFGDENVFPLDSKSTWPTWDEMISLIEKFCLASNDAAILNMAAKGKDINAFVSNDYDVLLAINGGALPEHIRCFTWLPW